MEYRKDPLVNDNYYHVFSRSIAKYIVFNDEEDYTRFLELVNIYRYSNFDHKYSKFKELQISTQKEILSGLSKEKDLLVEILAYCFMPTHFHLVLKQTKENGISIYLGKVLNSYTRYFNAKHGRSGPLWASRFKNVLVGTDEQLLHLTRYIHLNPSSAGIVDSPYDWKYSSLNEYSGFPNICNFDDIIDLSIKEYKKFIIDRKDYQRNLSLIKGLLIDDYAG
jgi:putative transposase